MKTLLGNWRRAVRWAPAAAAVVLALINLFVWIDRTRADEASSEILDRYAAMFADGEPSTRKADTATAGKAGKDERAERIGRRHLFAPAPEKKPFAPALTAVLDQTAYFDGSNAVKAGDKYKEATVKVIGPDWVEVEVDGKTRKLWVFAGGGAPSGPSPGAPMMGGGRPMPGSGPRPSPRRSPSSGPPGGFSPEMIARMKAQFATLTPEQKAKAIEQMPAELRAKLSE